MLLSMTGFGEARFHSNELSVGVEVRAVNNRHLKVTVRGSEPYPMLEPDFERVVRKHVRRGTVLIHIRCEREYRPQDYLVHAPALKSYIDQVRQVCESVGWAAHAPLLLGHVLSLPGVTSTVSNMGRPSDTEWNAVETTVETALRNLDRMRRDEGRAMANELLAYRNSLIDQVERIRECTPTVSESYRNRLKDRITQILAEHQASVTEDHLIREVALYCDRSDVSEELMRLRSHLDQFQEVIDRETDGPGRKLEFLTQEMFREANTIGSKAGDVQISRHVVEIKATIEKIREMVQNVE